MPWLHSYIMVTKGQLHSVLITEYMRLDLPLDVSNDAQLNLSSMPIPLSVLPLSHKFNVDKLKDVLTLCCD